MDETYGRINDVLSQRKGSQSIAPSQTQSNGGQPSRSEIYEDTDLSAPLSKESSQVVSIEQPNPDESSSSESEASVIDITAVSGESQMKSHQIIIMTNNWPDVCWKQVTNITVLLMIVF